MESTLIIRVTVVLGHLLSLTHGTFYPPDCPAKCECNETSVACEGGGIPSLDFRLTSLHLQDPSIPIPSLTPSITQSLNNLVSLELESVGLTEIQSGALAIIDRLQRLKITNNNILVLTADAFVNCSALEYLNLSNNNIQAIEDGTFAVLTSIQNLSLANNALLTLPKFLPAQLKGLDVEHNKIADIQNLRLPDLKSLNLCQNSITHIDADEIELENLEELCIGGSGFKLNDRLVSNDSFPNLGTLKLKGAHQHPIAISNKIQQNIRTMAAQSLHTLELDSCRLDSVQFFDQANSKLEQLRATNVQTPMPVRTRFKSKFQLPSIAVFDVSGSPFLANLFLNSAAPTRLLHLKVLKMSGCEVRVFPESLLQYRTPNISKLDLSHNPLQCTCYGLSWIPRYVRDDKLDLLREENTTCASPSHLQGIPLLLATLCPFIPPSTTLATTTSATTTIMSPHLRSLLGRNSSSKVTGKCSNGNGSQLCSSGNDTISSEMNDDTEENSNTWLIIIGIVAVILLVVTIVIVLLLRYHRSGLLTIWSNNPSAPQPNAPKSNAPHDQEPAVIMSNTEDQISSNDDVKED